MDASLIMMIFRPWRPSPRAAPTVFFDLTLSGGMMMNPGWTINSQAYPDSDPLIIHKGERIRFQMANHSMMWHPMHLHGHFFRVGNAVKDTVLVPPHMGQAKFDFTADNPGRWFFHCHNICHMEAGMAREVHYARPPKVINPHKAFAPCRVIQRTPSRDWWS